MTTSETRWQCPPRRIAVAVDFREASGKATAVAGLIASAYDARLVAVHAERFDPPPYFTPAQLATLEAQRLEATHSAARDVSAFVARHTAYPAEPLVIDDDPAAAIRAAAETADLVVVGTHNSRGPFRWWLGSVAEHVALESPAPVLVIGSHAPPVADVLERVAVIRRGGPADDVGWQCAGVLAKVVAGRIVDAGTMASCGTDALAGASCAVLTLDRQTKSSDAAADVADLLSRCPLPLLIVPV